MAVRTRTLTSLPIDEALEEELRLRLAVERAYQAARSQVFDVESARPRAARSPHQLAVVAALEAAEDRVQAFRSARRAQPVPAPRAPSGQA